jgi:hypothetical protein
VIVVVPVDANALRAYLPTGFEPRAAEDPAIHLDAYVCASGVGFNGTLEQVEYGSWYVPVDATTALREPGYDAYFVKMDFLVPDEARRLALATAGFPARDGSARVTLEGDDRLVDAVLDLGNDGGFALRGTMGAAVPQARPLPFVEYTPLMTTGTLGRWHARLHDARIGQGTGVLTAKEGSSFAGLTGTDPIVVSFIGGAWNLDEADVAWPIVWPEEDGV